MTKTLRKTTVCLLAVVLMLAVAMTVIFSVRTTTAHAATTAESVLFTGNGDYTQGDSIPAMVNGQTSASGLIQNGFGWLELATLQPSDHTGYPALIDLDELRKGMTGGNALGVQIGSWGISHYNKIKFNNTVNAALTESVTFRIYANLSPEKVPYACKTGTTTFTDNTQGIFIYGVNATGQAGEGILIQPDVTQNQWVDITVDGDQLWKLADDNGNIGGFTIASAVYADPNTGFYQTDAHATTWADTVAGPDQGAIVFIDKVTAENIVGNGASTSTIADGAYVGKGANAGISFTAEGGVLNFAGVKVYSYALGEDGKLYASTENGRKIMDMSAFDVTRTVTVSLYTGYGANALIKSEKVPEGSSYEPNAPARDGYDFLYWSLDKNGVPYDTSNVVTADTALYAVWSEKKITTFQYLTGYNKASNNLTAVEGKSEMALESTYSLPNAADWDDLDLVNASEANLRALREGSDDGRAVGTCLPNWGFTNRNAITFTTPLSADSVESLTFRIYVHFSSGKTYGLNGDGELVHADSEGVFLYGTDSTGAKGEGILLPYDIKQDEWIDFTVSGNDLKKLVSEGQIKGFALGARMVGSTDNEFYGFGGNYTNAAFLLVDYVRSSSFATVTYKDGNTTLKTEQVLTQTVLDATYIPDKNGYVFSGWNTEHGEVFGYNQPVYGDVTLQVEWKKIGDFAAKAGLYEVEGKSVMLFADGEIRLDEAFGNVYYAAYTEDHEVYIFTDDGRKELTLGNAVAATLVTYYGKTVTSVYERLYVKNGAAAPNVKVDEKAFLYWSDEALGRPYDFNGIPASGKLYAVWNFEKSDFILTDAKTGYSLGGATTLKMVDGASSLNGGTVSNKIEFAIEPENLAGKNREGSINDTAFRFYVLNWGFVLGKPVYFTNPVPAAELDGLTFRMYVHLSEKTPFGAFLHDGRGVRIYGIGADGSTGGVLIPNDIKQDSWIDFTLSKEDVAAIADKDGYVSGFMLASALVIDNSEIADGYLYNYADPVNIDNCPNILIDYVMANYGCTVHYADSNGEPLKTESALSGLVPDKVYVPTKNGYVFTGYGVYDKNSELQAYDFANTPVCQDIKLYAQWVEAKTDNIYGLYTKDGSRITIAADGLTVEGLNAYLAYGVGTDNVLYVTTAKGVLRYNLNDYTKVEAFAVLFTSVDGQQKTAYFMSDETVVTPSFVRPGYALAGWKNAAGEIVDPATLTLSGDITLTAVWEERTVPNDEYVSQEGTVYHSEDDGSTVVLYASGKAVAGADEYTFRILVSGEIIIEGLGNGTVYGPYFTLNGVKYVKVTGTVVVSFAVSGQTPPEAQTLSGNYKVTRPQDPAREGYEFIGWVYPDGTDFDFDKPVFISVTLSAKWKAEGSDETIVDPVEPENPTPSKPDKPDDGNTGDGASTPTSGKKKGCKGAVQASCVLVLAAGVALSFAFKRKRERKAK